MSHQSSAGHRLGVILSSTLTSVEILPGDGKEWLLTEPQDSLIHDDAKQFILIEGNLGVPHKILCQAYLEALPVFNLSKRELSSVSSVEPTNSTAIEALIWTSSVILLLNPGHQTAWNVRKRLVELQALNPSKELSFITALLTIRDCAKHSLLWHHRRWLLRRLYPLSSSLSTNSEVLIGEPVCDEDSLRALDIPTIYLRNEFTACTTAANTYERNYFAWAHRFRCLDALSASLQNAGAPGSTVHANTSLDLLNEEAANVALWIERHVADYTAMQYHCRLACLLYSLRTAMGLPPHLSIYSHAMSLVESYPEHESLWHYLRGAAWAEKPHSIDVNARWDELKDLCNRHLQTKEAADHSATNGAKTLPVNSFLVWLNRQDQDFQIV